MAQLGGVPVLILKEGSERTRGKDAQRSNIMAARVIAEAVRSTLGPRGMDKMLVDSLGDVTITNDGAAILDEIDVQHPAAKMLVGVAKTQDDEVGDGTTTAVIIAGELLKRAEELLDQKIHPTIIVSGYKKATDEAKRVLDQIAIEVDPEDVETLKKIAVTSMNSKSVLGAKEHFADIAVKAIKQIAEKKDGKIEANRDMVNLVKKQGKSILETELVQGMVVDKELVHPAMPKIIRNAKIALVDAAIEIEKTEFDAEIRISDPTQMQAFLDEEQNLLKQMVETIKNTGANVIFSQKGIDDTAQHYLAKAGIAAVRRVKKSDMEKLAKATGATIVTSLKELKPEHLGYAGLVEELKVATDKMVYVRECKNPKAVTIVIRGGTEHVVDEGERALNDALSVVRDVIEDRKMVAGGGAPEVELAKRLRDYAESIGGREQLAIEAFADSLEIIPKTLAENAGHDQLDIIVKLRAAHEKDGLWMGVNVNTGEVADMLKAGVLEPLRVKKQAIASASEAAEMILRIDDVIASKPHSESKGGEGSPGGKPGTPGGGPPGMGGMPGMM
ncbi:MAG: thermosome subunit beta [Candidatus Jordarchaeaceae archaeon]